jgi:acyl-CoA dehydrogenase
MDFSLNELQRELVDLARQILRQGTAPEHLAALEASGDRLDRALWRELVDAGLGAVGLAESAGGPGLGFFETCLVLEEAGRTVAPVPLAGHACGMLALQEAGAIDTIAKISADGGWLAASARQDAANTLTFSAGALHGTLPLVPYAAGSRSLLVPATCEGEWQLVLLDTDATGLMLEAQVSTSLEPCARLQANAVAAQSIGRPALLRWLAERLSVATCALQTGVVAEALDISTRYVAEREQFGVKIGSFQSVNHRLADCFIDLMNLRLLVQTAASRLDREPLATLDVLAAQNWSAEAGHRVLASCQHVHGGIGHDRSYGLWRYALAARHLELLHGGCSATIAALGAEIARNPVAAAL